MTRFLLHSLLAICVATTVTMTACQSAADKRAASPNMSERIKHDSVSGEVTDVGTTHVSIRDASGETTRVRVDDRTKMDHVVTGDKVKAYVTDEGYASTIQRVGK